MLTRPALLDGCHGAVGVHVTRARAISELGRRVKAGCRFFIFLMRPLLEVARVTSGTVRLIGREFPRNGLGV